MTRTSAFQLIVVCKLGDEYFLENWNDLTPEIQKFWEENRSEPYCEASGVISSGCHGCDFCELFEEEEI